MSSWKTTSALAEVTDEEVPWERQAGETARAFQAFGHFRDLGPSRTYPDLRAKGYTYSNVWVSQWDWTSRASQWDDYQDRIRRHEIVQATKEMAAHHVQEARSMLNAIMAPVRALNNRLERDEETTMAELEGMPMPKLISQIQASGRVMQPIMNAERLSRGLPTEVTEGRVEHVHKADTDGTKRISEIIDAFGETGVLAHILRERESGEIVDAEVVEIYPDTAAPEADGIPASSTS